MYSNSQQFTTKSTLYKSVQIISNNWSVINSCSYVTTQDGGFSESEQSILPFECDNLYRIWIIIKVR